MKNKVNDEVSKKYICIGKESGCFSSKYLNTTSDDEESIIIPYESSEESGRFRVIKKRPQN